MSAWFSCYKSCGQNAAPQLLLSRVPSGIPALPQDVPSQKLCWRLLLLLFRLQVQKIRLLLRQRGLGAVRVGTVDDYQVCTHSELCVLLRNMHNKQPKD
jgi:hypothetical protein